MQIEREKLQLLEGPGPPSEGLLGAGIDIGKVCFREARGDEDDNNSEDAENMAKAMMEIDDMDGLQNGLQAMIKEPKKAIKVSSKVAPLVAALNE